MVQVLSDEGDTCPIHIYLNGNQLIQYHAIDHLSLDASAPTRLLDGLELHFGPNGPTVEEDGCGSLLLWSEVLREDGDWPFLGSIGGAVRSASPDSVIRVELEPLGQITEPDWDGGLSSTCTAPGFLDK